MPIQLICMPFAGAGASFYHQWSKKLTDISIKPIQLPGRERQIAIPPYTNLNQAADALVADVRKASEGQPIALFGHCFLGSVLAYEIALRLEQDQSVSLKHLFISASRTPDIAKDYGAINMSDAEFVAMVQQVTGYQHPAFAIPEMLELLLPSLRADFEMDESYPGNHQCLSAPITAIAAKNDSLVTQTQVEGWSRFTRGSFKLVCLAGGHMYLAEEPEPLMQLISKTLSVEAPSEKTLSTPV